MSSNNGLDAIAGTFLTWMGSAAVDTRREKSALWIRMGLAPTPAFRLAAKNYVAAYNVANGTHLSVSFPRNLRMVLRSRSSEKTDAPRTKGQGRRRAPSR